MTRFRATSVEISADTDHGEGAITFIWPDEIMGWDCLSIDLDGHCSRRMPIHSGSDNVEQLQLFRDRIRLRFTEKLAMDLQMDTVAEIEFTVSDETYAELRRVIAEYFGGDLSPY